MEVQYIHNNTFFEPGEKVTYYFELPDYDLIETEIMKKVTDSSYRPMVSIIIGKARCNKSDNYVKKIGREVSFSKRQSVDLNFRRIGMSGGVDEIEVSLDSDEIYIQMVLRKSYRNIRILSASEE
jgi:hypothetical protein